MVKNTLLTVAILSSFALLIQVSIITRQLDLMVRAGNNNLMTPIEIQEICKINEVDC